MLLRFTSISQQKTNSSLHNQNSEIYCPFLTDYNYLSSIRATAKSSKKKHASHLPLRKIRLVYSAGRCVRANSLSTTRAMAPSPVTLQAVPKLSIAM